MTMCGLSHIRSFRSWAVDDRKPQPGHPMHQSGLGLSGDSPGPWRLREGRGRPAARTSAEERRLLMPATNQPAISSSTARPVRAAQAQVQADSERAIVMYQ